MRDTPHLRVLFPTDFSAACIQTGRAISQLARVCPLTLTMAHVVRPGQWNQALRVLLQSFLAESRDFSESRRVMVEGGDPARAIAELCGTDRFDLIMAPASGRRGLGGMLAGSFRARLLERCDVPLWTAGDCLSSANFGRRLATVACLVDFDDNPDALLESVSAFARCLGARMHAVSVLPPIDDGTLVEVLTSTTPLLPEVAVDRIRRMCASHGSPEVHVAVGTVGRTVPQLLSQAGADLLVIGPRHAAVGAWTSRVWRDLDRLPCPLLCVAPGSTRSAGWAFRDLIPRWTRGMPDDAAAAPAG